MATYWVIKTESGKLQSSKLYLTQEEAERTAENVRKAGKKVTVEKAKA